MSEKMFINAITIAQTVVIAIGITGHITSFVIFSRRTFKNNSISTYCRVLAIIESFTVNEFIINMGILVFNVTIYNINDTLCKIYFYITTWYGCISPWILVIFSIDKMFSMRVQPYPILRKKWFQWSLVALIGLFKPLLYIFIPIFLKRTEVYPGHLYCDVSALGFFREFMLVVLFETCLIPFTIMTVTSIVTIRILMKSRNALERTGNVDKERRLKDAKYAISSLTFNFMYVVFKLPIVVFYIQMAYGNNSNYNGQDFCAIKCPHCQNVLDTPVFLPCSDSICKKHVNQNDQSIRCHKCGEEHQIPKDGFPLNKGLAEIIQAEISKLDFGKTHSQAKESCKSVENVLKEAEVTLRDPRHYTHQKINDLRNTVQLKGGMLKLRIDQEMTKLLDKLDEYELQCKDFLSTNEYTVEKTGLNKEMKRIQSNLDSWIEILNKIKLDEEKWKSIINESEQVVKNMNSMLDSLKNKLLLNKFDEINRPVSYFDNVDINPVLKYLEFKLDSSIINNYNLYQKLELLKNKNLNCKNSKLLYRASRDGFGANDYHSRCDDKNNLITIIKATSGNIFGGYIRRPLKIFPSNMFQTQYDQYDQNSFIFSLVNQENRLLIFNLYQNTKSYNDLSFGPIFGDDIVIYPNSNISNQNYSNLGTNFTHPEFPRSNTKTQNILAGSKNFQVSEIEVFQI